ncbi:hypothetical protein J7E97_22965 [Streptomyces sp. ISL-66]|uniref:hypothetical protein n=1 Tax=Streptomyces sp. ISL-66 TaxID=2819186 RepID=UPI001BE8CDA7|nr:hypothetical protein [Streptomyces sp. ISL-66]MBT2470649.1 hypothetical protein [Streptomyces sp. ISL-66]
MQGMESKRQEPGKGREEQAQEHPGPDPVHPEASKPVAGKSPEELRRMQERKMARDEDADTS